MLAPLIPPAKRGGNKRRVDERALVDGLAYILSTGCQWRAIPRDLPPRSKLHRYFCRWEWDDTLTAMALRIIGTASRGLVANVTPPAIGAGTWAAARGGQGKRIRKLGTIPEYSNLGAVERAEPDEIRCFRSLCRSMLDLRARNFALDKGIQFRVLRVLAAGDKSGHSESKSADGWGSPGTGSGSKPPSRSPNHQLIQQFTEGWRRGWDSNPREGITPLTI